ncbi:hypothetical protein Rleg9DRAFT_6526 [Rhizobium leguminosarum bv. trifolii WSM597]|uniref:Uncharacterized protein n=1 Tax=Rhizobium leguminosarum bv. trifolii WSM597 TaxID=754764 RepID=I9NL53_RHILT|nr:hypothetical protein [Rhizobium leguminosarum]EJB07512.1 hypothetical protein Rleg9DRAFT_6526 [Rhizobium leguminosarum bv. trifolii WSM597]
MPLSNPSPLPSVLPHRAVPLDVAMAFAITPQTLTASGYVNSQQAQIDIGNGLWEGRLTMELTALDLASGDETYRLLLLGSNDSAFGNGNVDILATQDFAAASAGRLLPTVAPASTAVPPSGRLSARFVVPVTNLRGQFLFRYLQLYALLGGTTPSISLTAWLAPDEG